MYESKHHGIQIDAHAKLSPENATKRHHPTWNSLHSEDYGLYQFKTLYSVFFGSPSVSTRRLRFLLSSASGVFCLEKARFIASDSLRS
jgi:hypothetical protein